MQRLTPLSNFVTAILATAFLCVFPARSQSSDLTLPVNPDCIEANREAMAHVASGNFAEAAQVLSIALKRFDDTPADPCTGLTLHNLATVASISGQYREAERLASRSIAALETIYPPEHLALLRPLLLLASSRLEQRNKSGAREAFKRIRAIRPEKRHEQAMVHALSGSFLQALGDRQQAEAEYVAALDAWNEIGRGETTDAAAVLTSLGTLYIDDRRFEDARRSLDRGFVILSTSKDAGALDHSKLLTVRGVLHARLHEWPAAERDFRDALALADGLPRVDPGYALSLLTSFAQALDKNHRRKEAHSVQIRAASLRLANPESPMVDVSDLMPQPARRAK